jgi:hypothetical protein
MVNRDQSSWENYGSFQIVTAIKWGIRLSGIRFCVTGCLEPDASIRFCVTACLEPVVAIDNVVVSPSVVEILTVKDETTKLCRSVGNQTPCDATPNSKKKERDFRLRWTNQTSLNSLLNSVSFELPLLATSIFKTNSKTNLRHAPSEGEDHSKAPKILFHRFPAAKILV